MNLKTCKKLRKEAAAKIENIGQGPTTYLRNQQTGTIFVNPECKRGIYHALKRNEQ